MKQLSEKTLNLTILKSFTESSIQMKDSKGKIQDGTLFFTSFGTVIGGISKENSQNNNLSELFVNEKKELINKIGIESLIQNGEVICVKNAYILQNNRNMVYKDNLFIHIDSILGFSLCNIEEAKKEFSNF